MGSIEQWLSNAIQATTAVGQLILGVATHRTKQAEDWGNKVEEITGLEPDELRRAVEADPALAELLWRSLDAAAETASDDKRHLLAQVAAAALRGDTTPERIDRLQFLMRPVLALDPPHITLLVVIGKLIGDHVSEANRVLIPVRWTELVAAWPGGREMLDPAIAALEREALIANYESEEEGHLRLRLRPFGAEFLNFLLIDAGGWPPTRA
jgi:hypothetical protein